MFLLRSLHNSEFDNHFSKSLFLIIFIWKTSKPKRRPKKVKPLSFLSNNSRFLLRIYNMFIYLWVHVGLRLVQIIYSLSGTKFRCSSSFLTLSCWWPSKSKTTILEGPQVNVLDPLWIFCNYLIFDYLPSLKVH